MLAIMDRIQQCANRAALVKAEHKDGQCNEIVNELIDSEISCCSGNQEIVEYKGSILLIFVFDEASSLLKIKSKKKDTPNFHTTILRQLIP
ncbi:hypothetical protein BpHYR1_025583 [Brachionus plicatilis]|uniref:Uncharacterized protein n=1 Tax=Brachionus plicatilis TaxID=10195 RepID=A0A3M7S532_BRAPC|nr:hypothetical protein BpHYR1_025583 [Brachionus plicatilis]